MALPIAVINVLVSCIGLIAGQSTLLSPSQSTVALNQTASLNASTASTYSPNSTIIHYQTSYLKPSSPITALAHSSVPTAPPITTSANNEDDENEEEEDKKEKTAIIAASCSGGAILIIGVALVIWSHRKKHDT
ncbi:unnamed protein product [Porites lobata]|uniref:Uncharacterized protein n=1 Tax=Porites lobata TaxID=104759 RepID=A0ABN8N373_9CNID|nr:unnamed protein product [Porites lobata]